MLVTYCPLVCLSNIAAVVTLGLLVKRQKFRLFKPLLAVVSVSIIAIAIYTVYYFIWQWNSPAWFYPGIIISTCFGSGLIIILLVFMMIAVQNWHGVRPHLTSYIVGCLFISVLQMTRPLTYYGVVEVCNRLDRAQTEEVALVLQEYVRENQTYPKTLNDLVPDYLPQLPVSSCQFLVQFKKDIKFYAGTHVLGFRSVDNQILHYYDLATGTWDSEFDEFYEVL